MILVTRCIDMDLVIFFCAWAQECKKIRFETGGLCQDIKESPKSIDKSKVGTYNNVCYDR